MGGKFQSSSSFEGQYSEKQGETSQDNEQATTNTQTPPSHIPRHTIRKRKTPNKEKAPADDKARRPASKLGYLIIGCLAFSTGYIIREFLQADIHCNEGKKKEFFKKLLLLEKTSPDSEVENKCRTFVTRVRKQGLKCKGISERASLRCIDSEKALLLRKDSEIDVKLADMERCPATKDYLWKEKKVLKKRINELKERSKALKVEFNHSTARNLELSAYEDRAVLVTQLATIVRKIEDGKTSPDTRNPNQLSQKKTSLEKELKDLDKNVFKLKAIINGAAEPDSDCRFHKIKADTAREFDDQSTKQRLRNGLTYESPQSCVRKSPTDSIGGTLDTLRKKKGGDENDTHIAVTSLASQRLDYGKMAAVIGLSLIVANGALR